jgi:Saxitoxin biosynthesis operon protein SxtJ
MMKKTTTMRDLVKFGIGGGVILGGIGALVLVLGSTVGWYLIGAGVVFLLAGLFVPSVLYPIEKAWMSFAFALGYVNTRLLLGLFYLVIMTPVALIQRLLRTDGLDIHGVRTEDSLWKARKHERPDRESYERQF